MPLNKPNQTKKTKKEKMYKTILYESFPYKYSGVYFFKIT